jgi:2-(1,2-epoxy-1,2-dihydrophenyl)acetyl-CoA isomerase
MSDRPILFEASGGVARITLNRPDKLNSFTASMHALLREAIATIQGDSSLRVLLLTGSGRGFCAGQDLSERKMTSDAVAIDLGRTIDEHYNPLVRSIRALEIPVVCAVNGVAAGAGANIALSCDIVLAARSASFIQAFSRIGLVLDCGGSFWLPRLAGTARAMGLALLGDKLSAEQAAQWGLIWKCVDDDKLMDEANAIAASLAQAPTRALAAIKRAIHAAENNSLDAQLDLERDLQRSMGRTEDYREGVAAFLDKREPAFKGK